MIVHSWVKRLCYPDWKETTVLFEKGIQNLKSMHMTFMTQAEAILKEDHLQCGF